MCFFSSPSMPAAPAPVEPPKPPQVAKAPEVSALKSRNKQAAAGGMSAGANSTLLTGPSGIDATALSLGRTLLLGQ